MQLGLSVSDFSGGLLEVAKQTQGDYFSRMFHIKRK
jgi:alpha-galactosidase